jgi:hypothetical protein
MSGTLTTNDGSHHLTRRWSSLLAKELDGTLQKKDSISGNSQETKLLSSYLGENLFLDICGVLLQGNYLGSHSVDHLPLLLPIFLKELDHFGLSLHLPDEIVDHIGQLVDLQVLNVNMTV